MKKEDVNNSKSAKAETKHGKWRRVTLVCATSLLAVILIAGVFISSAISNLPNSYHEYQSYLERHPESERKRAAAAVEKEVMAQTSWSHPNRQIEDRTKPRQIVILESDCQAWFKERFKKWFQNRFDQQIPAALHEATIFFHDGYALLAISHRDQKDRQKWITLKITVIEIEDKAFKLRLHGTKIGNMPLPSSTVRSILLNNAPAAGSDPDQREQFIEGAFGEGYPISHLGPQQHFKLLQVQCQEDRLSITFQALEE